MASYIPDAGEDLAYTGSPYSMRNFQNSATAQAGQRGVGVTQQLAAQFMAQAKSLGMDPNSPQAAQYVDQQFAAKRERENIMNGANTKAIMGGPGAVAALAGLTMGGGALLGAGGATTGGAAADAPILLANSGQTMTDVAPGILGSGSSGATNAEMMANLEAEQATQGAAMQGADPTVGNQAAGTGLWSTNTFGPAAAGATIGGATGSALGTAAATGGASAAAAKALSSSDPNTDPNTNINAGAANPSLGQTTDPNAPGATADGVTNTVANGAAAGLGTKTIGDLLGGNVGLGDLSGVNLGDAAKFGGNLLPGVLGYLGSSQQTDAYKDLAGKYMAMGAPYRDRLSSLYTPEGIQSYLTSPDVTVPTDQATSAVARALSTKGNPTGSGNALQELQNYSSGLLYGKLGQERDRLAGFGGLSNYSAAAPGASNSGIQSQGNEFSSIGYGLGRALNPQPSFADVARMFGGKGFA